MRRVVEICKSSQNAALTKHQVARNTYHWILLEREPPVHPSFAIVEFNIVLHCKQKLGDNRLFCSESTLSYLLSRSLILSNKNHEESLVARRLETVEPTRVPKGIHRSEVRSPPAFQAAAVHAGRP